MTPEQRHSTHAMASIALFSVAAVLVVLRPILAQSGFTPWTALITFAGALVVASAALNGLPVRGLRIRRGDFSSEALFQDAPVAISLFVLLSAESAAIATLAGFTMAAVARAGGGRLDMLRQGALRAIVILALAPVRLPIVEAVTAPTPMGALAFVGLGSAAALGVVFICSMPFVALHTSLPLGTIWKRLAKDRRLWYGLAATIFWSYVIVRMIPTTIPIALVALWMPIVAYSYLLRRVDDQAVELHRLRLVRDAVQAMLGARDPLPQVNAILSSIHGTLIDESISIVSAAGAAVDDWKVIASLGQPPSTPDLELRRRALTRLKFAGMPSVTLEGELATMHAFAIRMGSDGEMLGALVVRRRDAALADNDQRRYAVAASDIAPLLRDIRSIAAAQNAATTDALTGLKNRASILETLRVMLGDVVRNGAVLLLDIDHFKRVNDELGHPAGDACLRRIAELAIASVRGGDSVGRIGGEEFLIVMPGATRDSAMMVGERLRLAISLSGLRHSNGEPVTASLGAAAATTGDTAETLVARADRALYEAKRSGRNRIVEDVAESA